VKRVGNLYLRIAEPENLRLAFWKAQRGKSGKAEVMAFRRRLEANLAQLRSHLLRREVPVGDYHYFTVYDPKERRICAAAFPERVLHHAVMNVCEPVFERYQVFDSYASRKGKGTYAALQRAARFTRRHRWYIKLDVRKYFDSIDHCVLKRLLGRLFKDSDLLKLLDRVIDSYETAPGKGVPIGNLTSQFFANHVLAVADHFAKETLRLPAYVRYMDDMVLWHDDKRALLDAGRRVEQFIRGELALELKTFYLNRCARGLPFLGYIVLPRRIRLSARSRRRYTTRLRHAFEQLDAGEWTQEDFARHANALVAFTEHAEARGFRRKVMEDFGYCPRARTA